MEGTITMSTKKLDRAELFSKLKQKFINQQQVADILGFSLRQVRRLFKDDKRIGVSALISKKRRGVSNHQLPAGTKELVLALIQEHYADFGPTLAHEKIEERND